jgi:hypothetical protein
MPGPSFAISVTWTANTRIQIAWSKKPLLGGYRAVRRYRQKTPDPSVSQLSTSRNLAGLSLGVNHFCGFGYANERQTWLLSLGTKVSEFATRQIFYLLKTIRGACKSFILPAIDTGNTRVRNSSDCPVAVPAAEFFWDTTAVALQSSPEGTGELSPGRSPGKAPPEWAQSRHGRLKFFYRVFSRP